jgi:hypothetical protein
MPGSSRSSMACTGAGAKAAFLLALLPVHSTYGCFSDTQAIGRHKRSLITSHNAHLAWRVRHKGAESQNEVCTFQGARERLCHAGENAHRSCGAFLGGPGRHQCRVLAEQGTDQHNSDKLILFQALLHICMDQMLHSERGTITQNKTLPWSSRLYQGLLPCCAE